MLYLFQVMRQVEIWEVEEGEAAALVVAEAREARAAGVAPCPQRNNLMQS